MKFCQTDRDSIGREMMAVPLNKNPEVVVFSPPKSGF